MILKKKNKLIKTGFFLLFFVCSLNMFSQHKIQGVVQNSSEEDLYGANVLLKQEDDIITYTSSGDDGDYSITTGKTGQFNLVFSYLGFKSKTISIEIKEKQKEIEQNIILENTSEELDEVVIKSKKPIKIKKDTIALRVENFVDGTEQTVEDLLKELPGVNIGSDGTIKIGNQEIEKLMIEGDDFFEKGYKILSKNMPAYPIEEVEVLKNFSNNKLLKGIEESDKVALNLKLDDESKNVWFGNIKGGLGNDGFYELKGNLMEIGKKNKYYFLTDLNTIGTDATGSINNLIYSSLDYEYNIGNGEQVNSLLDLSTTSNLGFKDRKSNFNNAKMASFNAILHPLENLKVKTLGFINWDHTDFYKNSKHIVNTGNTNFTNIENEHRYNRKRTAFGRLDLIYDIADNQTLKSTTKYNDGNFNDGSDLVYNGNSTIESLDHRNRLFDQRVDYTNKLTSTKALLINARFIDEKSPHRYNVNQFYFEDLFPDHSNTNAVKQDNTNDMQYAGVNAHYMDRKRNGNLLELDFGNEYRRDKLLSQFSLVEENSISDPEGYQNKTNYQVNDLYLKGKYRFEINNFSITGSLGLHQLFNRLRNDENKTKQHPFFMNPKIGLSWKINEENNLTASYGYNKKNAEVLDVYNGFVMRNQRSFSKGTGGFNQLNSSTALFSYQLGDWSSRFFANVSLIYTKDHDFLSTNRIIEQDYSQSEKILIKNKDLLSLNTDLNYYFKFITSNLKLNLGYSKSNFKNKVNSSNLREVTSSSYDYGVELRSSFIGAFNFHIGTNWTSSQTKTSLKNSYTDNVSFLNLSAVFNDKFDITAKSERYYFGNLKKDKSYYFLDVEVRYKLIKDRLTLGLSGKNLFDTKTFRRYSISDIGTTVSEYRLLPRYVLLKAEIRF